MNVPSRLPRYALLMVLALTLLAGAIAFSLELINHQLLQGRHCYSTLNVIIALLVILLLACLGCRFYGLNRWVILPLVLGSSAVLALMILCMTHSLSLPSLFS